jgi:hypothetical protein
VFYINAFYLDAWFMTHLCDVAESCFYMQLAMAVSCICTSNAEAFPGWDILLKVRQVILHRFLSFSF